MLDLTFTTISGTARRFPSGVETKSVHVPCDLHGRLYKSTDQRIAAGPALTSDLHPELNSAFR